MPLSRCVRGVGVVVSPCPRGECRPQCLFIRDRFVVDPFKDGISHGKGPVHHAGIKITYPLQRLSRRAGNAVFHYVHPKMPCVYTSCYRREDNYEDHRGYEPVCPIAASGRRRRGAHITVGEGSSRCAGTKRRSPPGKRPGAGIFLVLQFASAPGGVRPWCPRFTSSSSLLRPDFDNAS